MPSIKKTIPKARLQSHIAEQLGPKLRYYRELSGSPLGIASAALGTSFSTLNRYEQGLTLPPLDMLYEMSILFGFQLADVLPTVDREKLYEYGFIRRDANIPKVKGWDIEVKPKATELLGGTSNATFSFD